MNTQEMINDFKRKQPTIYNNGKRVKCVESGEVWENMHTAAKELNINYASIYNTCTGRQKTCFGLHFELVK